MPLYEYQCVDCDRALEVLQKVSDPDPVTCSHCGGKLERQLSAPAIRFKGAGWYVNDYGKSNSNGSPNSAAAKDTPAPATSESSSKTPSTSETKS
jgi:putative FmdB family regulatory protein